MLHHHFPLLDLAFSRRIRLRKGHRAICVGKSREESHYHQAAPLAPTIRGRDILMSILICDPIARIRSSCVFERWQEYDLPAGRVAGAGTITPRAALRWHFSSRESSKRPGH
jgi:hypothetical protein